MMIIIFHLFYPYIFLLSRQNLKQKTHTEPKTETLQLTFYYIDLKVHRSRNSLLQGAPHIVIISIRCFDYLSKLALPYRQNDINIMASQATLIESDQAFVQATHSLSRL